MELAGRGREETERFARPLAPRIQLIFGPAVLYLVSIVGSAAWWWLAAVLLALCIAWLGSAVIRRKTVPWFILSLVVIVNLTGDFMDLIGLIDERPSWQNAVTIALAAAALQALFADSIRPRQEVWEELVRRWPLVFAGLVVLVATLVTGDDTEPIGALEETITVLVGGATLIWVYFVWRAVRKFKAANQRPSY